uniref:ANK_REP_REGION domain-containing protein n=1 Tax=Macrostomum lignano TaxID=282301 RepID=A0A1I8GRS1_9PLAT
MMQPDSRKSPEEILFEAATRNDKDTVEKLLENPLGHIDWGDLAGCTALYRSCERGFTEVAKILIDKGARLDAVAKSGNNPVWIAAANGRIGILRLLCDAGVKTSDASFRHHFDGRSPANVAVQIGQDEALDLLLKSSRSVSDALVLRKLLVFGADPNQSSPLSTLVNCNCLTENFAAKDKNFQSPEDDRWSPLRVAAYYGRISAVQVLLDHGANLFSTSHSATSILQAAALTGRLETVRLLLDKINEKYRDDVELLARIVSPAVFVSGSFCHADVFRACLAACPDRSLILSELSSYDASVADKLELILQKHSQETTRSTFNQSKKKTPLHDSLNKAGFLSRRAAVQAVLSEALELLLWNRLCEQNQQKKIYVVGSYAEGWGCSVTCLNGSVDVDSDIDVTTVLPRKIFHIKDICKCSNEKRQNGEVVDYNNGHVTSSGFARNPSLPYGGCSLRPAVDKVDAFLCCCYPQLRIFEPGYTSQLSHDVLKGLDDIRQSFPCHVVPAELPACQSQAGSSGSHLRLSTTFFERYLLQNLTTVQGQVYVTLKYLVKRVLSIKVSGLKSYHVKTIIFYMLEEVPKKDWKPEAVRQLAQQGLQRLLDCLRERRESENECMKHFFLTDTFVYLKRNHSERHLIEEAVQDLLLDQHLDAALHQLICQLKPCSSLLHFHPNILHPILSNNTLPDRPNCLLEDYEVYDAVSKLLLVLSDAECNKDVLEPCWCTLRNFPKCARTTSHCLTVLTYMMFGMIEEAKAAVRESLHWTVSKGVPCSDDIEVSPESILTQLLSTDSVYKFGFRLDRRPTLHFLPEPVRQWFPVGISYYMHRHQYYVNFHALLRCLTLHLLGHEMDKDTALEWFREVADCAESDAQELLMVLKFCTDGELLVELIHNHRVSVCEQQETLLEAVKMFSHLGEKAGEFGAKTSPGGLVCNKQQGDCMAECARKIKAEL